MKERRIGRVRVSRRLLLDAVDTGDGANLFAGAVPLNMRDDWLLDEIEYVLWHPQFDIIAPGEIAPEYRAEFYAGKAEPRWVRV